VFNAQINQLQKKLSDGRNIVLYLFVFIVLAICWSTVKTIQTNYDLQKQISQLQQQNTVINLQNQNTTLQNKYYQTDAYLDLAARQDLGLAAPGEQVLLVSRATAMKYVNQTVAKQLPSLGAQDHRPTYIKNLDAWRDFLLGRSIVTN
jgi:cell division protein FtsB